MKGESAGPWQNGASCSTVRLAAQSEGASSIVLPWLRTSPLTSTGRFSNVWGCPKGGQVKRPWPGSVSLGGSAYLGPGGWAGLVFTGEPTSQRARRHLDQRALLDLSPLVSSKLEFLPSFFICPSVHRHSVTTPQSLFWVLGTGLGAGNMEVKEAGDLVSWSQWYPAIYRAPGAQEGLRRLPGGGGI